HTSGIDKVCPVPRKRDRVGTGSHTVRKCQMEGFEVARGKHGSDVAVPFSHITTMGVEYHCFFASFLVDCSDALVLFFVELHLLRPVRHPRVLLGASAFNAKLVPCI